MRPVVAWPAWRFNTWIWPKRCIVLQSLRWMWEIGNLHWGLQDTLVSDMQTWVQTMTVASGPWANRIFERWILDVPQTRQVVRLVGTRTCSKASFRAGAVSCNQLWRAWALSFQATTYRDRLNVDNTAIKSSSIPAGWKIVKIFRATNR